MCKIDGQGKQIHTLHCYERKKWHEENTFRALSQNIGNSKELDYFERT